jgi:hypothetical protein
MGSIAQSVSWVNLKSDLIKRLQYRTSADCSQCTAALTYSRKKVRLHGVAFPPGSLGLIIFISRHGLLTRAG